MAGTALEIAFVCERCNALSPMAAALARESGGEEVEAWSAGIDPDGRILPGTLTALREIGIDTTTLAPAPVRREALEEPDVVVAIGLRVEEHPLLEGLQAETWDFESPQGGQLADFRHVRDQLGLRVRELLREHGVDVDRHEAGPF